jgi:hypothetical protein
VYFKVKKGEINKPELAYKFCLAKGGKNGLFTIYCPSSDTHKPRKSGGKEWASEQCSGYGCDHLHEFAQGCKPRRLLLTSSLDTFQLLDTTACSSEKKDHIFSTSLVDLRWSTTLQSGSASCPPRGVLKVDMKMEHVHLPSTKVPPRQT